MPDVPIVAGKYRLIAKISEGGMGAVWSAEHLELNCPAAVKLLSAAFADSQETLARFKREAQAAASLRSTNIVQILDFGIDNGVPYIAMELLRGHTLAARLSTQGRLTPRETAIILSQVARAVTWAHGMGIIHRDLKPGNIFLSQDAGETVVKLLDFGIAKPMGFQASDAPVTLTGTIIGTPQYMSPEQASGRRAVDQRTDIWSFGVVAYECLTGRRVFETDTLGSLMLAICNDPLPIPSKVAAVPKGFDEWFARCAHRDPERRFLSIAEAADVLRFVCGLDINASVGVPQLYSEPPSSPYAETRGASTVRHDGPGGSSTDAPSTITLGQFTKRGFHLPKHLIFGVLFVAGAVLAVLFRFGHASPSPAAALMPLATSAPTASFVAQPPSSNSGAHMASTPLDVGAPLGVAPSTCDSSAPKGSATVAPTRAPTVTQRVSPEVLPLRTASSAVASRDLAKPDALDGPQRPGTGVFSDDPEMQSRPESATTVEAAIGLRQRP
jgi:serine/threonine-protein kinase